MPMDETLGVVAVDFGGRTAAVIDTKVRARLVGDLQTELVADFFEGFSRGAKANVQPRSSTADRTITRSKRCSRRSPAPCAWHAQKTASSAACCPARRGCCDRHHRLRRRKSGLGGEGDSNISGRECVVTAMPLTCLRADKLIIPGVGNFKATRPLSERRIGRRRFAKRITQQKPRAGNLSGPAMDVRRQRRGCRLRGLGMFRRKMHADSPSG